MSSRPKTCLMCLAFLLYPSIVSADTLTLRNGDHLTGSLTRFKDGVLDFETDYSGTLKIATAKIGGVLTTGPVTVKYKSGGYATGRLVYSGPGTIRLQTEKAGTTSPIELGSVSAIYPGTELPSALHWKGSVNLGATRDAGATRSQSVHFDASTVGRGDTDRIRASAELNRQDVNHTSTQNDFTLFGQYDRFLTKKTFLYGNTKFEKNRPQNIKFRTTLGTGAGLQILENDTANLSVEAGPSYVNKDVYTGEDQSYPAGHWAVRFDYYIYRQKLQFFHQHEGNFDLSNTGNLFITSSTGVRYLMGNGFTLTGKADIDWDSQTSAGVPHTDRTYLFLLGYQW